MSVRLEMYMRFGQIGRNSNKLEVPPIRIYNNSMEIKNMNGEYVKVEKGDLIGDGFEEGVCVNILVDGGDVEFGVYDGKEGWSIHMREVKSVNGNKVDFA